MDIEFAPQDEDFRAEVRSFIEENYPKHLVGADRGDLSKEDFLAWHKILAKKGWVAPSWPEEFGGTGWTVTQKYIWNEESASFGTIPPLPFGIGMLGPVIYTFGNQEQKDWVLPGILSGETWWCQGYSEPGAGSDLAGLKTKAELDGDEYVVNGHKIWTTLAQHADWMFCLVRTSSEGKPQEGISFLLIDMEKSEGITVRPLITLDGEHEVNEVFFDDVKVPVENLVGEENKGWTCAKYLLTFERTGIAGVGSSKAALAHLKQVAREQQVNGKPLIEEPHFRSRLADVEMELMSLEMTNLRTVAAAEAGGVPGAESSFLKIMGTELRQEITDLFRRAAGPHALPFLPEQLAGDFDGETVGPEFAGSVASRYFNFRKLSIFGGSNEIQKNIISKMILGL